MADFIIVHDTQSLGTEIILNKRNCVMVGKMIGTGCAVIRVSPDPAMPVIACVEKYEVVKKMLDYVEADKEQLQTS